MMCLSVIEFLHDFLRVEIREELCSSFTYNCFLEVPLTQGIACVRALSLTIMCSQLGFVAMRLFSFRHSVLTWQTNTQLT